MIDVNYREDRRYARAERRMMILLVLYSLPGGLTAQRLSVLLDSDVVHFTIAQVKTLLRELRWDGMVRPTQGSGRYPCTWQATRAGVLSAEGYLEEHRTEETGNA